MSVYIAETQEELQDLVSEGTSVVVFSARDWCVPCQRLAPHIELASTALPDVKFIEVDVDRASWAMVDYGVQSVPTVHRYNDGEREGDLTSRTAPLIIKELS